MSALKFHVLQTLRWFSKKLSPSIGQKSALLESIVIVQSARRTADIRDLNVNIYCC